MSNPQPPITGTTIESAWGEQVVSRVVLTFATVTEANTYYALNPPDAGQHRVVTNPGLVQMFDGTAWQDVRALFAPYGWRDPRASWGILGASVSVPGQPGQDVPDGVETLVQQAGFAPLVAQTISGRVLWVYGSINLVSNQNADVMVNVRLRRDGAGGEEVKNGLVTVPKGAGTTRVPFTVSWVGTARGGAETFAVTVQSGYGAPGPFRVTHPCGLSVNDQGPASQTQARALGEVGL